MSNGDTSRLSASTWVPLGSAFTVVAAVLAGAMWVQTALTDLKTQIKDLGHSIDVRMLKLEDTTTYRWTYFDQVQWAREMEHLNPTMKVPNPAEIVKQTTASKSRTP